MTDKLSNFKLRLDMWPFNKKPSPRDVAPSIETHTAQQWAIHGQTLNFIDLHCTLPLSLDDAEMLLAHGLEMLQVGYFVPTGDYQCICRKRPGVNLDFIEPKE